MLEGTCTGVCLGKKRSPVSEGSHGGEAESPPQPSGETVTS